jgi:D-glycero-D-manno-heptose 1,7-bisphosphate phosphatase
MNKAVFLDKDGTLIPDIPYNVDPVLITLQDAAVDGLKRLQDDGYLLIIISNQSGVARGYFTQDKLINVEYKLHELLAEYGLLLSGFYYCPHGPESNCDCLKPRSGMLIKAAEEMGIDLSSSWMIGDILNDVEAGNRAGCQTVLINNGNETEWITGDYREPTFTCATINDAAEQILKIKTNALAEL